MTDNPELKTIGFTPAIYLGNQAMFHVMGGVPIGDALSMASDFLCLAKSLTEDAAYAKDVTALVAVAWDYPFHRADA